MDTLGFQPEQTLIYRFSNGEKSVCADPLELQGNLNVFATRRGKNINTLIDTARKVDVVKSTDIERAEGWEAMAILHEIVQEAFGLVPFNSDTGSGASRAHALGLLNHFHKFLKKNLPKPDEQQTSYQPSVSISETQPITATSSV